MDLYYLIIFIILVIIGYYSIKYLFFVFMGMLIAFYISYIYLLPFYNSINKISINI
jgi:hypothetical protein